MDGFVDDFQFRVIKYEPLYEQEVEYAQQWDSKPVRKTFQEIYERDEMEEESSAPNYS